MRDLVRLVIVAPVFNDWEAASVLLTRLSSLVGNLPQLVVLLVNDGSTARAPRFETHVKNASFDLVIVNSGSNLGHQRAIALGLAESERRYPDSWVVVMDADGEDDPKDIIRLIGNCSPDSVNDHFVVVAKRKQRHESFTFRALYFIYKVVFRLLTGQSLDFGNFSAISPGARLRLLYMPELWNHYPAALIRSRLAIKKIPIDRGKRYAGKSQMNLVSLVSHGLSAVSVFTDVVFTRLLFFAIIAAILLLGVGGTIVGVRLATDLAIPGWATFALGFVALGVFQLTTLLLVMTFIQLATRSGTADTPSDVGSSYIVSTTELKS